MEILTREITSKKVRGSKVDFSAIKISSKKVRGNNVDFSTIEITSKRVRGNNVDFSTIEITSKRVRGSNVDFSTIEITLTKVSGSNVDFSISEITLKKVSGSNVDFSVSEITSKKYVEMTWKFVEIWPSTYQLNIHVKSTSVRRGAPVGLEPITTSRNIYWQHFFNSLSFMEISNFLQLIRRKYISKVRRLKKY